MWVEVWGLIFVGIFVEEKVLVNLMVMMGFKGYLIDSGMWSGGEGIILDGKLYVIYGNY